MSKERINITLPSSVLKEIKKSAEKFCRSVSEEIEYRVTHPNFTPPHDMSTPTPTPENPTRAMVHSNSHYYRHYYY